MRLPGAQPDVPTVTRSARYANPLKFANNKQIGRDYVVPPLERLWWADDPAGHDAWIVGDEPCAVIDWSGFADDSNKVR